MRDTGERKRSVKNMSTKPSDVYLLQAFVVVFMKPDKNVYVIRELLVNYLINGVILCCYCRTKVNRTRFYVDPGIFPKSH